MMMEMNMMITQKIAILNREGSVGKTERELLIP